MLVTFVCSNQTWREMVPKQFKFNGEKIKLTGRMILPNRHNQWVIGVVNVKRELSNIIWRLRRGKGFAQTVRVPSYGKGVWPNRHYSG